MCRVGRSDGCPDTLAFLFLEVGGIDLASARMVQICDQASHSCCQLQPTRVLYNIGSATIAIASHNRPPASLDERNRWEISVT
jgi:hypothetical protein